MHLLKGSASHGGGGRRIRAGGACCETTSTIEFPCLLFRIKYRVANSEIVRSGATYCPRGICFCGKQDRPDLPDSGFLRIGVTSS